MSRWHFNRENGYLTFGRIFTEPELDKLRNYVDAMIADLPEGKRPEQMDVPHFEHPFSVQIPHAPTRVAGNRAVHRTGYRPLVQPFH